MSVNFGEDRLRGKGSLPDIFFVLSRVYYMANDNSRKFTPVSYTHLDVYKRQRSIFLLKSLPWLFG